MPLFKIPIHFSYLLYIATYSRLLAAFYFKIALGLCRAARIEPSLLLHPLDFLGGDDVPQLEFFPAMNMAGSRKLELMKRFFHQLDQNFAVLSMRGHSDRLLDSGRKNLRIIRYKQP